MSELAKSPPSLPNGSFPWQICAIITGAAALFFWNVVSKQSESVRNLETVIKNWSKQPGFLVHVSREIPKTTPYYSIAGTYSINEAAYNFRASGIDADKWDHQRGHLEPGQSVPLYVNPQRPDRFKVAPDFVLDELRSALGTHQVLAVAASLLSLFSLAAFIRQRQLMRSH